MLPYSRLLVLANLYYNVFYRAFHSEFYDLPNGSVTFFTITSPQQACLSTSNFHSHFPDRALSMTLRYFTSRPHHLLKDVNRLPTHQKRLSCSICYENRNFFRSISNLLKSWPIHNIQTLKTF